MTDPQPLAVNEPDIVVGFDGTSADMPIMVIRRKSDGEKLRPRRKPTFL